jgi:hypothetical protein
LPPALAEGNLGEQTYSPSFNRQTRPSGGTTRESIMDRRLTALMAVLMIALAMQADAAQNCVSVRDSCLSACSGPVDQRRACRNDCRDKTTECRANQRAEKAPVLQSQRQPLTSPPGLPAASGSVKIDPTPARVTPSSTPPAGLAQAAPNHRARITDPAGCASRQYMRPRDDDPPDAADTTIAVCASGERIGTPGFVKYWTGVAETCAKGKPPTALWEKQESVPFLQVNYNAPLECDYVFLLIDRVNVPLQAQKLNKERESSLNNEKAILNRLRKDAEGGSPAAQFLLATRLLDMDNIKLVQGPYMIEGVQRLGAVAKAGYSNEVFKYATELERKYPASASSIWQRVHLFTYGQLAAANDPRGYVKLAEHELRVARGEHATNSKQAASPHIGAALGYLKEGKPYATGTLRKHIDNLEFEVRKLQNTPEAWHLLTSAFVSGSSFLGTWKQEGVKAAVDRVEDCRRNKPAVDIDPTLRLAFSAFGCVPY